MPSIDQVIPLDKCEQGWLYKLNSRNLRFGVFVEAGNGFVGTRRKFDDVYPFTEYHHEIGAPHGTAWPVRKLERCPLADLSETHDYVATEGDATPESGLEIGQKFFQYNKELLKWLLEMEEKYKDAE